MPVSVHDTSLLNRIKCWRVLGVPGGPSTPLTLMDHSLLSPSANQSSCSRAPAVVKSSPCTVV
eukprot:2805725-Amphidinium_carterae.1